MTASTKAKPDLNAIEAQLARDDTTGLHKAPALALTAALREAWTENERLNTILLGAEQACNEVDLPKAAALFSEMRLGEKEEWRL